MEEQVRVQAERTLFFIRSDGKLFTWTALLLLIASAALIAAVMLCISRQERSLPIWA